MRRLLRSQPDALRECDDSAKRKAARTGGFDDAGLDYLAALVAAFALRAAFLRFK